MTAKICGWETDKICLYPYGGISKFNTHVNVPIKEEFLVLIMGPIVQILTFHILALFLSTRSLKITLEYHRFLLWFNLLPIYPLDGGKLLNLLFCKYTSFQKSFQVIIIISYLAIFLLSAIFLFDHSFFFLCVLFLLIFKIQREKELFPYIFHKFLLERCLYCWNFPKKKIIQNENQMKKDTEHFFKKNGRYIQEQEYLKQVIYFPHKF